MIIVEHYKYNSRFPDVTAEWDKIVIIECWF